MRGACPDPINLHGVRRGMIELQIENRVARSRILRLAQAEGVVDVIRCLTVGASWTTGQMIVVDGVRAM